MTTPTHPYEAARKVLKNLHGIFLEHGHRLWSVSPVKDGTENFAHLGLDADAARKTLRLLATKGLVEYRGVDGFVITDHGVTTCDHPEMLDHELPMAEASAPAGAREKAGPPASTGASSTLDQYLPAALRSRFVAVDHIGGGSFGTVYQIMDRESLQRFALKVTVAAPDAVARAHREAGASRDLHHEHIMSAIEFHPQGEWFIFPLAEGTLGNLHAWGRLNSVAAHEVALAVGSALVHAHAAGVLHRDLHIDNILRFDGAWRVADWGLAVARGSERLTRTRSVGGLQTWTAPEQLRGLKNADERSDLFSLGRVVEWLATGVVPDISRAGALPVEHPLAAFVNAATQLDPSARPVSVAAAMELLPSTATTVSVVTPFRMPRQPVSKRTIDRYGSLHRERLSEVQERRGPFAALDDGPAVLLHVYPVDDAHHFDLLPMKQAGFEPLPPIAHVQWHVQFSHDGLRALWPDSPPAAQQLDLYRNGSIEFVDTYAVQRIHRPKHVLVPLNLERDIVAFLGHWIENLLTPIGVGPSLVICLSITGIQGFELHIDDRAPFHRKATFDRPTISLQPVGIDGLGDLRRQLKPTFDALWQAAGEDRSLGYSLAGEWLEDAHPRR